MSTASEALKTPKSLKEIERFLEESMTFEDCMNTDELKLQTYRTAFDAIMQELKTYRPVLSKIKQAYDSSLNKTYQTQRELDDTRQSLLLISEKCEAKLAANKQSQIKQIVLAKKECDELKKIIKQHESDKHT